MVSLRPYQQDLDDQIVKAWDNGAQNVLAVLPCGGGKTVIFSNRIVQHDGASIAISHRQELLGQMSRTLARYGVKHRIIGPKNVVRNVISSHIIEFGRDFYDPSSHTAVASVDTLASWAKPESPHHAGLLRFASQVSLWVTDEAAHLLGDGSGNGNKWGRAIALFTNAKGLGVTATPLRADGKGLGRHADGPFDCMVEGPQMRDLINMGFLTDYRIFCPPSDLDLSGVAIGSDGDYARGALALKTRSSTIIGHVVESYLKIAPGKLGVTFAPDVEIATTFSKLFNEAGVPAEVVTAKTNDKVRTEIMKRFAKRQVLQLVSVDIFSEGLDLPAIEVVSMARATMSYSLYVQQFGRGLRLMDGKDRAIIIDHVQNCIKHNLPDKPCTWSLDRRDRKAAKDKDPNDIPMRVCANPDIGYGVPCAMPYERSLAVCPACGWTPLPAGRTSPELVEGDLFELDAATLAAMRGEVLKVDRHPDDILRMMQKAGHGYPIAAGAAKQHANRQVAQTALREAASWWLGYQKALGRDIREAQRRFYFVFGADVLSIQTLGRTEAEELTGKIYRSVGGIK